MMGMMKISSVDDGVLESCFGNMPIPGVGVVAGDQTILVWT
jgi:hypothetical protein